LGKPKEYINGARASLLNSCDSYVESQATARGDQIIYRLARPDGHTELGLTPLDLMDRLGRTGPAPADAPHHS
jgi:hypothetical protein